MSLVTLGVCDSLGEAYVIKSVLEAHGIKCFVADDIPRTYVPSAMAIKIHIAESDLDEAIKIVREIENDKI